MHRTIPAFSCLLVTLVALLPAQRRPDLLQERIDHAIDKGIVALLGMQTRGHGYGPRLGHNALAMLALLHAGVERGDPHILKLKRHLLAKPAAVYDLALRLMVIDELKDPDLRDLAARDARRLIGCQGRHGGFHYGTDGPPRGYDNSCTQYGILGLRAAHNIGLPIPRVVWARALRHQLRNTGRDGGVGYTGTGRNPGLTAGGLASLVITSARAGHHENHTDLRHSRIAIKRMKKFLERQWKPGVFYADYALERAMAFSRTEKLGKRDWYRTGAQWLCDHQMPLGSWGGPSGTVATSFALLFLSRASKATANETPGTLSTLMGRLGPQAKKRVVDVVVEELVGRGDKVVPALVPYLMSEHRPVREASVRALRQLTKKTAGYDPSKRPSENRSAIERWRRITN